ncbi:tRNA (adenosine(37)-N6)-threonylcarbamoyltransferase complex ATPase subunit type 1 TsaE [Candidatus Saccharibacteria bacterium]|nr:tRNA (adenosine(37)-N6)-threonylcarbamoyltransferase complex ATPase subunit type 1 TsaE [Candidatus Saccharibacteria bacterium]
MKVHSEQEMIEAGKQFGSSIKDGAIIELVGDVGAGKTTFTRGLALALGVTEPVTSPSFTISKTYAASHSRALIHYDFYRLSDPGIMSDDLAEHLSNPHNIIVVEWGDSVTNLLPDNHITVSIDYNEDGSRSININQ